MTGLNPVILSTSGRSILPRKLRVLPEYMGDRGVIYDIYCITESGEQFIVEMQNKQHVHFRERALYYLSKTVARQGEKGAEWKFDLNLPISPSVGSLPNMVQE